MQGKILIIDDESKSIFQFLLEQEGLTVWTADDGLAGLEIAQEENPDVILLDLLMPKLGGEEFLKRLQEKGILRKSRVIIVTGFNDFDATKTRILKNYPIDFYLDKPVSCAELTEKIGLCLARKEQP